MSGSEESTATAAAAAAAAASLEQYRKSAVPRYRQPGVCRRKRIICSEMDWDRCLQQLKDAMGEYRVLGFDVECINMHNPRQVHRFQNQEDEMPSHFHRSYAPPVMNHLPPRYQRQYQGYRAHLASPPLDGSSGGEGTDGGEDNRFPIPQGPLSTPVLPTPQSHKRFKEVAVLIQLATWSGLVVMLRLCFWRAIPDSLREFLSDARYLKLGVGIDHDVMRLLDDWGLIVRGWIDLRHLCLDLCIQFRDYQIIRQMGLKKLAEGLFGSTAITMTMPLGFKKMRAVAWSDWNAVRLKDEQIRYAAWDAQIAVDIFSLATQRLYNLSPPQRESRSYFDVLYAKCAKMINVPHSRHPRGDDDEESDDYANTSRENSVTGDDDELRDLYNNCRMHAEQTGNRGFRSGVSQSPNSTTAITIPIATTSEAVAGRVSDDGVKPSDQSAPSTPTPTPIPTPSYNAAGPSNVSIAESKPEKPIERRSYCSVSVSFVKKSGIAIMTVNNSPKNVLDFNTVKSMIGNLHLLEDSKDCRGIILASACPNVFSFGFDLNELRKADPKRLRAYWAAITDLWLNLYKTRLATVAAVNGVAGYGGFVMATCCDRRIMASGCGGVGFTEISLGLMLPHWIMSRISQIVGCHKAEFVITRGHLLEAEHALEFGLVDRVTSKDRLLEAATDELEKLLSTPDYPRVNMKWIMRQPLIDKVLQERERCLDLLTESIAKPQTQELLRQSFMPKSK